MLRMEKFRGEQKNVTRFRDFLFLFYQYDFVVGLLPMNQEVIPRGQGFDQNKVPAVEGFYLGFAYGKINIPAIGQS